MSTNAKAVIMVICIILLNLMLLSWLSDREQIGYDRGYSVASEELYEQYFKEGYEKGFSDGHSAGYQDCLIDMGEYEEEEEDLVDL